VERFGLFIGEVPFPNDGGIDDKAQDLGHLFGVLLPHLTQQLTDRDAQRLHLRPQLAGSLNDLLAPG